MYKSVILPLLAAVAVSVCPLLSVSAAEGDPLPSQVPARTASGATNINDVWLHNGGGRLYQNTLVAPRQIALEGARFVDPAAVPELTLTPPANKKAPVRHACKAKPAKAAPAEAANNVSTAPPKGVGKTSLAAPVSIPASSPASPPANASAIPPLSGAGAASAPKANTVSGADSPYSAAAASPVGGVGGSSATQGAGMPGSGAQGMNGQASGSQTPVPVPAISAEDVLPRANARP